MTESTINPAPKESNPSAAVSPAPTPASTQQTAVLAANSQTTQQTAAPVVTPEALKSVQVQVVEAEEEEYDSPTRPTILPHAFVVMPFGKKKGGDGSLYDFNAIYNTLIKPALELAGFEPFRADEETTSGDILTDMFQELLLADLCLCDLSIDNANVYYELGIRHAFRKRGVVHIQAGPLIHAI